MDINDKPNHQPLEATTGEGVKETAPSGIDLHPEPQKAVRISRRAGIMIVFLVLLLMLAFAYGGYRRALDNQTASRDAGLPKSVTPATQAASEFMQATPAGTVPMTLRVPDVPPSQPTTTPTCGADPKTGQPYRFNPQTGQPCDGFSTERVVVRQPNTTRTPQVVAPPQLPQETPEQRRIAAAYQREQEAILAPTSIRNSDTPSVPTAIGQPGSNDLAQAASSLSSCTRRDSARW